MQPHFGNSIAYAGAVDDDAPAAMILVHGRNASPAGILELFARLDRPRVAAIAPGAFGGTWYPFSFLAPREQNEPGITSGLFVLESLVADLLDRGFTPDKIVVLGFSQGACLASDFALRHPRRYGGIMALSGGLIGPPGTTWDDITGTLAGTPKERVLETEAVFERLGASVTRRLYPGMGHLVNDDEIAFVRAIVDTVLGAS